MEERKISLVKQRKLKKWEEYMDKIPLAWRFYQRGIEKGTDPRKAELQAVKKVYPADKNSSTTLNIWRKYRLWPPSEELLSGGISGEEQSRNQNRNGLSVISGGGTKKLRKLKDPSENGYLEADLSEKETLRAVKNILDKIETRKKEWTGGKRKKYSTIKTRVIAGRLPVDLLNEIHRFKGSDTYHLERALRLYIKILGTKL
ncbi:MAG: hypothetical protein ACLQPD_34630 [Desulfomonilaceae bacterium]